MTHTLRRSFFLVLLFLTASAVYAQDAAITHVFPQFVDGVRGDGAVFTSRIVISSIGGLPATCNISLFGIGAERLTTTPGVEVKPASWETISTRGQDVLATGYARLDCSQAVFASLTYTLRSANGTLLGIATVSGAPVASNALIPMVLNGENRYAVAMANNNDGMLEVLASLSVNGTAVVRSLQVPARSHYVAFVDDIFSLPAQGAGTLEILANGSTGADNFNITALLFDQGLFTNVVPAVIH